MEHRIAYLSKQQLIEKHKRAAAQIASLRDTLEFIRGKTNRQRMAAEIADAERQLASITREITHR